MHRIPEKTVALRCIPPQNAPLLLHVHDLSPLAGLDDPEYCRVNDTRAVDEDGDHDEMDEDEAEGDLDDVADALREIDHPAGVAVFLIADGADHVEDGGDDVTGRNVDDHDSLGLVVEKAREDAQIEKNESH